MRFKHITVALALLAPLPVSAATFTFDAIVTQSIDVTGATDRPNYPLPDVGSLGSFVIEIAGDTFDGSPDIPFSGTDLMGFLAALASFTDLSAALEPDFAAFIPIPTGAVRFSNGDFSSIVVDNPAGDADTTLAGSFTASSPLFATPATTLSDVLDLLGDPTTTLVFSFNGTVNGAFDFVSFRAESVPAPIPLPAGGLLLLGGLASFAAARAARRRA